MKVEFALYLRRSLSKHKAEVNRKFRGPKYNNKVEKNKTISLLGKCFFDLVFIKFCFAEVEKANKHTSLTINKIGLQENFFKDKKTEQHFTVVFCVLLTTITHPPIMHEQSTQLLSR